MSFESDIQRFSKKLIAKSHKTVKEMGDDMLSIVKDLTPVDTGKLKVGYKKTVGINETNIINDVPYGGFVNDGTAYQEPNFMIEKTVDKVKNKLNIGAYTK